MPGTLALVVAHAHRRACALQAAAGVVHTVVPVRHSRHRIHWADSCSAVEHCRYHAVALGELPPAQRWPRRARSAREQNRMEGKGMSLGETRHRHARDDATYHTTGLHYDALDRDRCGIYIR